MGSSGTIYQVVLAAHVLCAVVGFGSILVTGGYAHLARPRAGAPGGPGSPGPARRYFRPGTNWASRLIFAVPVLGLVLAGLGGGGDLHQVWLWVGSGLWVATAGLATAVLWPAEAGIQAMLAPGAAPARA
ncbi:MAG: hypothetical protein ACRDZQ_15475, partial [Acidimicrobiales bacterium]